MKHSRFEDLPVWIESKVFTLDVYKKFSLLKDFAFKDQIQRASISIMNNISEGFERKGNKELSRFLYIAKGSAGEVRSMLYIAKELSYITDESFSELFIKIENISKQLSGFIKSLE